MSNPASASIPRIKFKKDPTATFMQDLRERINRHFEARGAGPGADSRMWVKIIFWLGLWAASYALLLSGWITSGIGLLAIAFLHGSTHLFIAFNISHDANHNSISNSPLVNRLLSYSLDLVGVNSRLWRVLHNQIHHSFVHVEGVDVNIEGFGVFCLSPGSRRYRFHRFQHLYWPLAYGVTTMNYVLLKDFIYTWRLMRRGDAGIGWQDVAVLLLSKAFYVSYVFVIPMLVLDVTLVQVLLTFAGVHFMVGNMLSMAFQTGHLTEGAHFQTADEQGQVDQNWAKHVIETTCDYASRNAVVNWFFGGINTHIIHHLLPRICHTHYPELAPIVRQTAIDHGMQPREIGKFSTAIGSHIRLLKLLGAGKHVSHVAASAPMLAGSA